LLTSHTKLLTIDPNYSEAPFNAQSPFIGAQTSSDADASSELWLAAQQVND